MSNNRGSLFGEIIIIAWLIGMFVSVGVWNFDVKWAEICGENEHRNWPDLETKKDCIRIFPEAAKEKGLIK